MPYIGAKSGRRRRRNILDLPTPGGARLVMPYTLANLTAVILPPRKEDAPCCVSKRDRAGRLPVGFCSTRCVRRRS